MPHKPTDRTAIELPEDLLRTLVNANRVLVLSGAGMSAESGVPTFRDAQTGLWAKFRPQDLATPEAFLDQPETVWDWYEERRRNIRKVLPHTGHTALVELEEHFEQFLLVTQNVDSLHQQAGSRQVIELHGNIMRSVCSVTGKEIGDAWINNSADRPPASPHHRDGLARPGVVWFGEQLLPDNMDRANAAALECDLCFSVGTSTVVQPAASLPYVALRAGAVVVEINPSPTPLSSAAHFCLRATAAVALPAIAAALK